MWRAPEEDENGEDNSERIESGADGAAAAALDAA